jgi:hypothetical protein
MKSFLHAVALIAAIGLTATAAQAGSVTYALPDIGTFAGYSISATGQTYTGTGFVGEYSGNTFAHLFGLEGNSSETNAQVAIAALSGETIESAVLSYTILSNYITTGVVTITGYNSTGNLGYLFTPPASTLGSTTGTTMATNSVDITALLNAALNNGDAYLGLLFQDSVFSNWTYTTGNPNAANLKLTVTYAATVAAAQSVPEPTSLLLLGSSLASIPFARRRFHPRRAHA